MTNEKAVRNTLISFKFSSFLIEYSDVLELVKSIKSNITFYVCFLFIKVFYSTTTTFTFTYLGWKRETIIRGVTKNGGIKGDVTYAAPDSSNKFKQMSDITQVCYYYFYLLPN